MTSAADQTELKNVITIGDTEPSDPATDDLWFDTVAVAWKVWDGAAWQLTNATAIP